MKTKVTAVDRSAIRNNIDRIRLNRDSATGSLTGLPPGERFSDFLLWKKIAIRAANSVICAEIKPRLDGPRSDSWRKYMQDKTPKPMPTARQSLSGRS
jgi:hypothetical protein